MMGILRRLAIIVVLLSACAGAASSASAAESYDSCLHFIDTLPVTITSPGTWCLRHNQGVSSNSVNAIDIRTNNVTIECNGFYLGNVQAGAGTNSVAIYAGGDYSNITVRDCTIKGFRWGIAIYGNNPGTGHLIEDNRLWQSREIGIMVLGAGSVVRRNIVIDTGKRPGSTGAYGIEALGDVIDNVVDGVSGADDVTDFRANGIYAGGVGNSPGPGLLVQGNRVRNLVPKGSYQAYGISLAGTGISVRDNVVVQDASTNGMGIYCSLQAIVTNTIIRNYTSGMPYCYDAGGNIVY